MTEKTAKKAAKTAKAAKSASRTSKSKKVSLRKAVATLEVLLDQLHDVEINCEQKDSRTVGGFRKQVEGMVLSMKGACQGPSGQDDFSFP